MSPREYAVAVSLGILIGAILGGAVVIADVQPIETIDDAVGDDELAGVADGPRAGESLVDETETATEATPTAQSTDTATPTPTAVTSSDTPDGGSTGTATATAAAGGTTTAAATATATQPAFTFQIDEVTDCGLTCRTVTATVENRQSAAVATTAETRLYAGNTTASDAQLFQETRDLGTLQPGESTTTNTDVDLSASEAVAVEDAGGWVTIVTVVTDGDEQVRSVERRKVLE